MLKGKYGVAVVLTLLATSAMASNFRVADQVYLPAAGHVTGSRGETFVSDVWLSNVNNEAVDISVIFSSGVTGQIQNFSKVFTLAANEHREVPDFISAAKSVGGLGLPTGTFGQLIFNGCKAGGNCDVNTCPNGTSSGVCPDFRNLSVESRIYAIPSGGSASTSPTYGQLFSGIPWYNFVSTNAASAGLDKVFITGLRNTGSGFGANGTFRTNIGLLNASQYSTTQLLVKLFDKNGNQIDTYTSPTLGALGQQQLSVAQMFTKFPTGSSSTGAYVTVEQISVLPTSDAAAAGCNDGCPSFLAYGSLIDNGSDDPTTLETQYMSALTDAALQCIYNLNCKGAVKLHRSVHH